MCKNTFWDFLSIKIDNLIYIYITVAVVVFNLIAIFGIDFLIHDDPAFYGFVVTGKLPHSLKKISYLYAYKEWLVWNIMAISPTLVRSLYVLVLLVPVSCLFFYLLRNKLGFSRLTAATAAILPNILPYQTQIPVGINLSYTLWGLLFSLISVILGFQYLEKSAPKNGLRLAGAVITYFIACQLMEQSLFLFAPIAFIFLGYTKLSKRHLWLNGFFLLIAVHRLISILIHMRKTIAHIPLDTILKRFGLFMKWSLPSPDINPLFITIICFCVTVLGFISYLKHTTDSLKLKKSFSHFTKKSFLYYLYGFLFCWALASIVVFLCLTKNFQPRYVHISSFSINAIFVFSLFWILQHKLLKKFNLHIPLFILLILFSGIYRYVNLKEIYTRRNFVHSIFVKELKKFSFPLKAQIVISASKAIGIPKGWHRSSGYFKFILKREDVDGIIRNANSFGKMRYYNHFNPKDRTWNPKYPMTGISLERPVFLFSLDVEVKKLVQFEYALNWEKDSHTASWTVFKLDKNNGTAISLVSGTGIKEYQLTLEKLRKRQVYPSKIMWGRIK
jgi:hypothetical protein